MRTRKTPRIKLIFTDGGITDVNVVGRSGPLEPIQEVGDKQADVGGSMEEDGAGLNSVGSQVAKGESMERFSSGSAVAHEMVDSDNTALPGGPGEDAEMRDSNKHAGGKKCSEFGAEYDEMVDWGCESS